MPPCPTARSPRRTFTATAAATTGLRHLLLHVSPNALVWCSLHACEGFVVEAPPVTSGVNQPAGAVRWFTSNHHHPPPAAASSFGRRPPDPLWLHRWPERRRCGGLWKTRPRDVVRYNGSSGGVGNSAGWPPLAKSNSGGEVEEVGAVGDREEEEESVTVLHRGPHHVVVSKPPSVLCHHSPYAGSRARSDEPTPMLQRVRRALGNERRVNLVHRLDRGASGCLILAYADDGEDDVDADDEDVDRMAKVSDGNDDEENAKSRGKGSGATAQLSLALQSPSATKTYLALVRGEGILRGEDLPSRGWFDVDRPIRDESGVPKNATTSFLFVAGTDGGSSSSDGSGNGNGARASLVLARPSTGRWHQVRRHLNGLSHPILGDSTHGNSRTNREWRERFDLPPERLCLHLARVELPPTASGEYIPDEGLDVSCPLPEDMMRMLRRHLPDVLEASREVVEREAGIALPLEGGAGTTTLSVAYGDVNGDPPRVQARHSEDEDDEDDTGGRWNAEVLHRGPHHVVAYKPPGVVCHSGKWTYDAPADGGPPMLQRIRDAVTLEDGRWRRVNLVHRLDRGASGCILAAVEDEGEGGPIGGDHDVGAVTRRLMEALKSPLANKTYVAVTVGDSLVSDGDADGGCGGKTKLLWGGEWFVVDRPVRDGGGTMRDSVTNFRFVAGRRRLDHDDDGPPTAGIVLARPSTGRYHQIRQHLRGMFRPILGDTSHGYLRTNREWREERGLPTGGRVFLHLARLQLPATEYNDAVDVSCPIPKDMMVLLNKHLRDVLDQARPVLEGEGIVLSGSSSVL